MNRTTRHVSVDGQLVIGTCANGSFQHHKLKKDHGKMDGKKLVATSVSNRIVRSNVEGKG